VTHLQESDVIAYYRVIAPGDPYRRRFSTRAEAETFKRLLKRPDYEVRAYNTVGKVAHG